MVISPTKLIVVKMRERCECKGDRWLVSYKPDKMEVVLRCLDCDREIVFDNVERRFKRCGKCKFRNTYKE